MKIETLNISDLEIQDGYNVRSAKELASNAKEVAALMEATGDNPEDPRFLIRYVQNGKAKYTRSHATLAAALERGWKEIRAVKVAYVFGSAEDRLDLMNSNNSGHPISRKQQGQIYAALEQGVVADDFTGSIAEPANPAHWKVAPMSIQEIADKIGKTAEHIRQCIATFTLPEPIAELLEAELISTNPALKAMQWAKDDEALALRICKAAVREAGGEKATQKHFDAIKADYVKQKAVSKADSATDGQPEPEKPAAAKSDARNGDPGKDEQDTKEENEPELMLPISTPAKPATKKETKTIRESALTVILETDSEIDDDLATRLVDRLTDAGLLAAHLPF